MNDANTKKDDSGEDFDPLDSEIDMKKMLREGIRGKHVEHYRTSPNVVPLAPDVREAFPTADSVNKALRLVMQLSRMPQLYDQSSWPEAIRLAMELSRIPKQK